MTKKGVKYEILKSKRIPYGKSSFIEVSKKRATDDEKYMDYYSISKGYTGKHGDVFKQTVNIPEDEDIVKKVAGALLNIIEKGEDK